MKYKMPRTVYTVIFVFCVLSSLSELCYAQSRCPFYIAQYEKKYYESEPPESRAVSYVAMNGIQHGIQVMKKCSYYAKNHLLGLVPLCEGRCQYHREGSPHRMKRQALECIENRQVRCELTRYRTIDGSCNNININAYWGKSDRRQRRVLPNRYDDEVGSPRTMGCNGTLPSARAVSNVVHAASANMRVDSEASSILMQWGQFLAHDIVLTPILTRADGEELECCHGDSGHPECFIIEVPEDDEKFTDCITFSRSESRIDCDGIRQQINIQTSYIDGSVIYGANLRDSERLRQKTGGLLRMNRNKLPVDLEDSSCHLDGPASADTIYCTLSGDIRVNEQPALAAMHTLFAREHNRIAKRLAEINPHWDNDILYEETRRIVGAEIQLITYKEFLPIVLGHDTMVKYGLNIGELFDFCDIYDSKVDATISNSFAAAILRFGHTLIGRHIGRVSKLNKQMTSSGLENHFFDPSLYHENDEYGLEEILRWMSLTKSPKSDHQIEDSVRNELFQDSSGGSFDLPSLNIQRGRDHGLPSYNEFRAHCGLEVATHFGTSEGGLVNHNPEIAEKLQSVYACPEDIDLFTGGLTEERSPDSLLGPLQQCLLAEQFRDLKFGDRFYFERIGDRVSFTREQLTTLRLTTLSAIYCANTDSERVQIDLFRTPVPGQKNALVSCNVPPQINLEFWREER